jgi:hypothetical protein
VDAVGPEPVGALRVFLTHLFFFLTKPFLHFFFAAAALDEPLPSEAAIAEPAGTADAPVANKSVASTPHTAFRAFRIVVLPFFSLLNHPRRERSSNAQHGVRRSEACARGRISACSRWNPSPVDSCIPVDVITVKEIGRDVCADDHYLVSATGLWKLMIASVLGGASFECLAVETSSVPPSRQSARHPRES